MQPTIQPKPLWMISSHSKSPRQKTNWHVSIIPDTVSPISSPFHQDIFLRITKGRSRPAGNNKIIFKRFSFNISRLPWYTAFQDQNTSNSYLRTPVGFRVNTVDAKTIPRNKSKTNPATACESAIFRCPTNLNKTTDTKKKSIEKQTISRTVQARLCVMKIWYRSNSIVPPDEFVFILNILPQSFRIRKIKGFYMSNSSLISPSSPILTPSDNVSR